ncbi:MAG: glycoside hydrolase family 20 protein [Muribaculaceae bacterium]|nr:glycoside hydrolase family 20 protein [Muribaculaceae bacterium]
MKSIYSGIILLLAIPFHCSMAKAKVVENYNVIPLPQKIEISKTDKPFVLQNSTIITYRGDSLSKTANFLSTYIKEISGISTQVKANDNIPNLIVLQATLKDSNKEAYKIEIKQNEILINGASAAGVFHGIQTIRKSLPTDCADKIEMPAALIYDYPNFSYRGMHLDVSRHFFSKEEVKTYIDMLALHNLNNFHWHITDDQGWRIEIKGYPKLSQISSKRKETVIGRNPGKWDGTPVSGFFTQEDAKEIVAYAADRYINVVPEIDLPGHMKAALAAYPELGCTGGPYEVWTQWGVDEDVLCAGNDKTLTFISDVLNEIMDIFPSTYIHAGGDECPKARWEKCPKCQQRIKDEGIVGDKNLTAEQYLQSFVMRYANKVISARNRTMIGWDEVLEGNVGKDIVVMSWRGNAGGIEGAKKKHKVIMTPNSHMYFDFYQSKDVQFEPFAIGGFTPIDKVYNFDPVPKELSSAEAKYIIGIQANLWSEYISTFKHVQYMVLPRIAALSEVQWRMPKNKNFNVFKERLNKLFDLYHWLGYNYARHLLEVEADYLSNVEKGALIASLSTLKGGNIYYTLDGTNPTDKSLKYLQPIEIKKSVIIKACVLRNEEMSKILCDTINVSKSSFKDIKLIHPIQENYKFKGAVTLTDGITGTGNYRTGRWLGFSGNDLEAVIDLKKLTKISEVSFNCCIFQCDGVVDARGVEVMISDDGSFFKQLVKEDYPEILKTEEFGVKNHKVDFAPINARFVKVKILSERLLPKWYPVQNATGFLFVDEIIIN